MTPHNDPAFDIKSALDHEVERRFHPTPLVEALRRGEGDLRGRLRPEGPLARLPVAAQWIAVVAAVIAAITGLRSVYVDLSTREDRIASVGRSANDAPPPEREILPSPPPEQAAPPPAPLRPAKASEPASPSRDNAPQRAELRTVGGSIAPIPTVESGESVAQAIPDSRGAAAVPGEIAPADGPPRSAVPAPVQVTGVVPQFGVLPAGVTTAGRGMKLLDVSLSGRSVEATVRELPELGATLVAVTRLRGPRSSRRPVEPPARSPAAPAASGDYYVRMLAGGSFDREQEEYALTGSGLRVVPPQQREVWGGEAHREVLQGVFGLETVVATGGALVGPAKGEADASFDGIAGGRLYRVTVHGSPSEAPDTHRIAVTISRSGAPHSTGRGEEAVLAASFLIDTGWVVVLALPDPFASEDIPSSDTSRRRMVFLALSPRFDSLKIADDVLVASRPSEAPMLIDGPEPQYPEEAREDKAAGRVLLRATVGEDGSVAAVEVLEAPTVPGAKHLVAAAVRAVRQWRYLPARHNGRLVPAYVTIPLEFYPRGG